MKTKISSKKNTIQFWHGLGSRENENSLVHLLTSDFILRDLTLGLTQSADDLRSWQLQNGKANEFRTTIEEQLEAEGNHIVTRFTITGTDSVVIHAIAISKMHDDRIAECSLVWSRSTAKPASIHARSGADDGTPDDVRWPPWRWIAGNDPNGEHAEA